MLSNPSFKNLHTSLISKIGGKVYEKTESPKLLDIHHYITRDVYETQFFYFHFLEMIERLQQSQWWLGGYDIRTYSFPIASQKRTTQKGREKKF